MRLHSVFLRNEAYLFVMQIVLMPSMPSHPIRESHSPADDILEEIERFRCRELYLQAASSEVPENCRKHIFTISVHTYDGAQGNAICDVIHFLRIIQVH